MCVVACRMHVYILCILMENRMPPSSPRRRQTTQPAPHPPPPKRLTRWVAGRQQLAQHLPQLRVPRLLARGLLQHAHSGSQAAAGVGAAAAAAAGARLAVQSRQQLAQDLCGGSGRAGSGGFGGSRRKFQLGARSGYAPGPSPQPPHTSSRTPHTPRTPPWPPPPAPIPRFKRAGSV